LLSLRELQFAFERAVRGGDLAGIESLVVEQGIEPGQRLGIYANNVRENFLAMLEAAFPVLSRLAGRDWLRQSGTAYLQAHPSRSGNLHLIGMQYADFLAAEMTATPYAYFADVARLEWACQEALVAAETGAIDLASLADIGGDDQEDIVLELHPSAHLVESPFPLLAIWRANRGESAHEESVIRLDAGGSRLLLIRRDGLVEMLELPPHEFRFVGALMRRATLAQATEESILVDPGFDLSAMLLKLVRCGALSGWHLHSMKGTASHDSSSN
jgi:hypothetical protein